MTGAKKNSKSGKSSRTPARVNAGKRKHINNLWTFYLDSQNVLFDEYPVVLSPEDGLDRSGVVFQTNKSFNTVVSDESDNSDSNSDSSEEESGWRNLGVWQFFLRVALSRQNISASVSVLVHAIVILILFSIIISTKVGTLGNSTLFSFSSEAAEDLSFVNSEGENLDDNVELDVSPEFLSSDAEQTLDREIDEQHTRAFSEETHLNTDSSNVDDVDNILPRADELGGGIPFYSKKGSTDNRTPGGRSKGVPGRQGDVTKESEDAVERGLDWLARHQLPDGGWSFDLTEKDSNGREGACGGQCSNSTSTSGGNVYKRGLHPSRMAATAIALLPFLGAGYTHTDSNQYQKTVAAGLRYLEYNAVISEENEVDFRAGFDQDGAAYVQALVVLTFCEAYEMTKDPSLKSLAQGGLKKIENSQLNDGSWRYYSPGDLGFHANVPGDTSVLGWQMLALRSGVSAGFSINPSVAYRAGNFLDLVMSKDSRMYRYQPGSKENKSETWGTTAVGVLIREYLGWEPGNSQLDAGIDQIASWIDDADSIWQKVKKGSRTEKTRNGTLTFFRDDRLVYNLYFSYYAALALHHYGGKIWQRHFAKQRDFLVETQSRGGAFGNSCERGSWLFYDKYMNDGGRLLNTSLAILILETPYRYLPMYQ